MTWSSLLFVYGTLKSGHLHHAHLVEAGSLGRYRTVHPYPLLLAPPGNLPCLYERPGLGHPVRGEVYVVDDAILRHTDELEMVNQPGGYYRREIRVTSLERRGGERSVWTYFRRGSVAGLETGPWLEEYDEAEVLRGTPYRPVDGD